MTATYTPGPAAPAPYPPVAPAGAPTASAAPAAVPSRNRWALWGSAAGVLGFAGIMADGSFDLKEEDYLVGADVIERVSRTPYHVGIVLGLAATFALLVAAAGWKRWAERTRPDSLAARMIPLALTASAGSMILGYGFKGSFAVYLDGGIDEGRMSLEGLYSVFMFLDFAPFMAWWGVAFALGGVAWLALRHGAISRWIGVVAALFVLAPVGIVVATGLPGIPGVFTPLGMLIVGLGVGLGRGPAHAR